MVTRHTISSNQFWCITADGGITADRGTASVRTGRGKREREDWWVWLAKIEPSLVTSQWFVASLRAYIPIQHILFSKETRGAEILLTFSSHSSTTIFTVSMMNDALSYPPPIRSKVIISESLPQDEEMTTSLLSEPSPRLDHFSAAIHRQLFVYGGYLGDGGSELPTVLHNFSVDREQWWRTTTTGQHPPPNLNDGACISASNSIYLFGGRDGGGSRKNSLYKLDILNLNWTLLPTIGGTNAPRAKTGCGMVFYDESLVIFVAIAINQLVLLSQELSMKEEEPMKSTSTA